MWLRCAKIAEQIKVLFGVDTLADPRHVVLDVGPNSAAMRKVSVAFAKLL